MTPQIKLSPLQLREHRFTNVLVRAVDSGSPTAEPVLTPSLWFERVSGSTKEWRLSLTLRLGSANSAHPFSYEAEIQIHAVVHVDDGFLEDRKEQLALVNGFSILYSSAREMLLNITSRSANGAVNLPTVSFVELVTDARKKMAEANPAPSESLPVAARK